MPAARMSRATRVRVIGSPLIVGEFTEQRGTPGGTMTELGRVGRRHGGILPGGQDH